MVFETDKRYIQSRWGLQGTGKVEALSRELGFPLFVHLDNLKKPNGARF